MVCNQILHRIEIGILKLIEQFLTHFYLNFHNDLYLELNLFAVVGDLAVKSSK